MIIQQQEMDKASKVWIFQSTSLIDSDLEEQILAELIAFLTDWAAHSVQLHASGDIVHHRFIVIMVDERFTGTSGCSLDTMHQFIHYLEKKYNLNLMDRMQVAYFHTEDEIKTANINELKQLVAQNTIDGDTYVLDNLVATKGDYEDRWKVKIKDSWHKRFL